MKTYKISFFDIRLKINREIIEYAISQKDAEINFQFRNADYLILKVEPVN